VPQQVLALLVALAGLTGCSLPEAAPLRPVERTTGTVPVPAGAQEAVVERVVDGDTLVLRGRGSGPLPAEPTRVRVLLVDAPETGPQAECFGAEACARTEQLLPRRARVRVQADRDRQDRFGRTLLHVWTPDGGNLGEVLLAEGYATVLQLEPNRLHLEQFRAREQEARERRRGLWSECGG
jgi:micrococcal nuclease